MKDVLIQFSELAKLPKPSKGSLAPKQITELQQWASINRKSVCQNATRNFSTKDKPGTLSLNVYEASPPNENTVDFAALLGESSTDDNKEREDSGQDRADIEILHPNVTFVLFPHICRPGSLPTSTFYIVKLLEHLPDDDHVAQVRTDWYAQDLVDPILFTTTGEEYTVSKDGIKGTVHVTLIADDTVEITKNDNYISVVTHIGDNVLPFEEPEIDAEDDLDEREYERNRPKRSKRMTATACDFVYY